MLRYYCDNQKIAQLKSFG